LENKYRFLPDVYKKRDQKRTRHNLTHCLFVSILVKDGRQPADYGHDKRNNGNQLSHVKGPQQSSFSLLSSTAQDDYILWRYSRIKESEKMFN